MSALIGFLDGPARNAWIASGLGQEVYVRKTRRILGGADCLKVLDIGNVNTMEKRQHKGLFKRFLAEAFISAWGQGYEAIYIENVLTPRFADYFRRNGWVEIPDHEYSSVSLPCFYKLVGKRNRSRLNPMRGLSTTTGLRP
jgi:hypothetical protein